jgi:hypothetical protein
MGCGVLAYLDAGSGSMLLQVLLGGIAAVGVAIKLWWRRITAFFRRERAEDPAPPASE